MDPIEPVQASALINEPVAVFAYIAAVLGVVFWLSGLAPLKKLFDITPPVIYAYFIPTLSTAFGIIPLASPAYAWGLPPASAVALGASCGRARAAAAAAEAAAAAAAGWAVAALLRVSRGDG